MLATRGAQTARRQRRCTWHVAMRARAYASCWIRPRSMDALTDQVQAHQRPASAPGGTPVPRRKAPVRPCEGALPQPARTQPGLLFAVRAQPMGGWCKTFDQELGMQVRRRMEKWARNAPAKRIPQRHSAAIAVMSARDHGQRSFVQTFPNRCQVAISCSGRVEIGFSRVILPGAPLRLGKPGTTAGSASSNS